MSTSEFEDAVSTMEKEDSVEETRNAAQRLEADKNSDEVESVASSQYTKGSDSMEDGRENQDDRVVTQAKGSQLLSESRELKQLSENEHSQELSEKQLPELSSKEKESNRTTLSAAQDVEGGELIDPSMVLSEVIVGELSEPSTVLPEGEAGELIDPTKVLPDRKTIRDILRFNQVEALLQSDGNVPIKQKLLSYNRDSSNYLLQSKYSQLKDRYESLDSKQKDAINSGTENIKNTFNSIKQTAGGFNEMFSIKIDWEFWEKIVNNYEKVIIEDADHLNSAIASGIPREFRGIIWQLVAESKNFQLEEFYIQLKSEKSIHEKSIKRDLSRTSFFTNVDQVGKSQELFNVIKAYSLFDPDVGYTQGMIFITVPLIMNMTEAECFCLLVTLMKEYRIRELFCPEMKGLHLFLYEFDRLLEVYSPILFNHLAKQGIKSSMYASQWFLTFFAYKFPLDIVLRIYDILITQGSESILKFAVNLMIKNKDNLLLLKFDKLLEYLKEKMFNFYIMDNYIIKSGEKSDNRGSSTLPKRFSILGNRRASEFKLSTQDLNYYKLDELVHDSMCINIDPNELLRFEQEFENICKVEDSKLSDIETIKAENGELRKTIKDLEMKYQALNHDHIDILQKMVDTKVLLPETMMENEDLEAQITKIKNDIAEIEAKVQSPVSETPSIGSSITHTNVLPESIENNINQLLIENAQQLEKFSELEAEYSNLVLEDDRLTKIINQTKGQSWFGKWK
jgi:hypothetical protein